MSLWYNSYAADSVFSYDPHDKCGQRKFPRSQLLAHRVINIAGFSESVPNRKSAINILSLLNSAMQ